MQSEIMGLDPGSFELWKGAAKWRRATVLGSFRDPRASSVDPISATSNPPLRILPRAASGRRTKTRRARVSDVHIDIYVDVNIDISITITDIHVCISSEPWPGGRDDPERSVRWRPGGGGGLPY